jgi:hypothetical protein
MTICKAHHPASWYRSRICIVERIRISYFLTLSHVAMFYATTEQKLIHSFRNTLRIRRKINQLHRSSFYAFSIYYTTLHKTILGFADIGSMEIFFGFFSVSPLIHVKYDGKQSLINTNREYCFQ